MSKKKKNKLRKKKILIKSPRIKELGMIKKVLIRRGKFKNI